MSYFLRTENCFLSDGFKSFLETINCWRGRRKAEYPNRFNMDYCNSEETAQGYFKRIVDNQFQNDPNRCSVETDMAVLADLKFTDRFIAYANIQVFICNGSDLETFYKDPLTPCMYLRLDYDLDCLGQLFSHSLPHVHISADGLPRFGFNCFTGNIILDFFDFIYRNFYPDRWIEWARLAYQNYNGKYHKEENEMFDLIIEEFKSNNHDYLSSRYAKNLNYIKKACQNIKDDLFQIRIDIDKADLLSYRI